MAQMINPGLWLVQARCAYHGWEFNSEGTCTKIPQVEAAQFGVQVGF